MNLTGVKKNIMIIEATNVLYYSSNTSEEFIDIRW